MRARRTRRSQAGFTLVELMISLVMFSFAVAGILAVAVSMASGFREQRQVIGTESSARASMEFLSDAIRGAAPGVPSGNVQALYEAGCTSVPGSSFTVLNSTTAPDELTVVFAYGSVVTSTRAAFASGDSSISVTDGSQFSAGDMVLISNYNVGHLASIQSVSGNTLNLDSQVCASPVWPGAGYPAGSLAVRAMRAKFFIKPLDNIPTLFMDPDAEGPAVEEPLAEGVEDLQISLGIDVDGDGVLTETADGVGDEWFYNAPSEVLPALPYTLRAIKLSLVARATGQVSGTGSYTFPLTGDRSTVAGTDNYRRRVLTSTIDVRNLAGSK